MPETSDIKIDRAVLWALLTETTFLATLVGLVAIGHFVVPNPDITQGVLGLFGAVLLSIVWMRRFGDIDLRQHTRSHDQERL